MNPRMKMVHCFALDESDKGTATFNGFKDVISICWLFPRVFNDLFYKLGPSFLYINLVLISFFLFCVILPLHHLIFIGILATTNLPKNGGVYIYMYIYIYICIFQIDE